MKKKSGIMFGEQVVKEDWNPNRVSRCEAGNLSHLPRLPLTTHTSAYYTTTHDNEFSDLKMIVFHCN